MLGIISNQDLPGEEPLKRVFPAAFAMFSLPLARLLLLQKDSEGLFLGHDKKEVRP